MYRIRQQSPGRWPGTPELSPLSGPGPGILQQGPTPIPERWVSLGSPGPALASNPAVGRITRNDLLQLFVLGDDGDVYHLSQRRNSTW